MLPENSCFVRPLPRAFYERHPTLVGRQLLGKYLVKEYAGARLVGRIVEVESYGGAEDPASYVARKLRIGKQLLRRGGYAFLVRIHGHLLLNITAEGEGIPGAVLVRALEPMKGLEAMHRRRNTANIRRLCNGPGKLTKAFGISQEDDGNDLTLTGSLYVGRAREEEHLQVVSASRVGVRDDGRLWRFYIKGNKFVSCPRLSTNNLRPAP